MRTVFILTIFNLLLVLPIIRTQDNNGHDEDRATNDLSDEFNVDTEDLKTDEISSIENSTNQDPTEDAHTEADGENLGIADPTLNDFMTELKNPNTFLGKLARSSEVGKLRGLFDWGSGGGSNGGSNGQDVASEALGDVASGWGLVAGITTFIAGLGSLIALAG